MLEKVFTKLSLKYTAPMLLVFPVLVVVILLSTLSFFAASKYTNDLVQQNITQINGHISQRLHNLLSMPKRMVYSNDRLIHGGTLDIVNPRDWRLIWYHNLKAFEMLSSSLWGGVDGQAMWVIHYPGEVGYEFAICDEASNWNLAEYKLNNAGEISAEMKGKIEGYDPRKRPWYRSAIDANGPVWSEIYAWVRQGGDTTLGIAYAKPYFDPDGKLKGVLGSEISLNDFSLFLKKLPTSENGRVFVFNSEGQLLGLSSDVPVVSDEKTPLNILQVQDPYVVESVEFLREHFSGWPNIQNSSKLKALIQGRPYLITVSIFRENTFPWYIVTLVAEDDILAQVKASRRINFGIGIIIVVLTLGLGVLLAFWMIRPMLKLISVVHCIGQGDLQQKITLEQTPELRKLSDELNNMIAGLRDRMQLRNSLALAMEVQQNLLPTEIPSIDGLDVTGQSMYCDQTGGDYYDYLDISGLSDTTLAVALGDVVGHGVAAAMLMASARGVLRSRCGETGSLADLLNHMNAHLCRDVGMETGKFMTMLLLTIDARNGQMRWASAGHDMPFIYDPKKDQFLDIDGSGLPLGISAEIEYQEYSFDDVQVGQIFFVATDGVWEALNDKDEQFGKQRVREVIRSQAAKTASEISQNLHDELSNFRGPHGQDDDITFVIIKIIPLTD